MRNLLQTYDEELAFGAQKWAEQCVRGHDCDECRTLPRGYRVGQNLYWYGHLIGSWEESVKGWYDEVADFNNTFVSPFYVIPGILVGHYTALVWAQSLKVGCGKLYSYPDGDRTKFGQEFYICNYAIQSNWIGSEMYKNGEPCSACPPGTSCSERYPGLCSGEPEGPVTIRPPLRNWYGPEGLVDEEVLKRKERPSVINLPPVLIEGPSRGVDKCRYECMDDGGCSVKFITSSSYNGSVLGSCFSPFFGGSCKGTPSNCKECSSRCSEGDKGMTITVKLDDNGNELSTDTVSTSEAASEPAVDKCMYNCQESGGCSVRIITESGFVSGSVLGSCFSPRFGGSCSGIPDGCEECIGVCSDRDPGEFTLPAAAKTDGN